MHATLNVFAGVPAALSVSSDGIHLGFCVLLSSLSAAFRAIPDCTPHKVALRLDFHRRWAHDKFLSQIPN